MALEADVPGAAVFIVAAADTVMEQSSRDLMAEFFPGVPVDNALGRNETLLSIGAARAVLGYAPWHSWRSGPAAGTP